MTSIQISAGIILLTTLLLTGFGCSPRDIPPVPSTPAVKVPQDIKTPSPSIGPPPPAPVSLDEMYERAKPVGPPGKLDLDLIAFPYCGLSNIRKTNDPDAIIQLLEKFPYLVCAEPGRLSPQEKIISESLKDKVKIFGYVYLGEKPLISLDIVKKEIDNIAEAKWYGVFLDQFGYDFGETRARQNEVVNYAHSKGLHCFVNAWFIDDALGNEIDPEHNPQGEPTHLGKGDWYLMESFLMNNGGYVDWEASWNKYIKGKQYQKKLGVKIAVLSYKPNGISWENVLLDIRKSYLIALALGFDGWWYSDKLEDDNFLYGQDPHLNWGDVLLKEMSPTSPNVYVAETDQYILVFNTSKYPPIRYIIYDKTKKKQTPPAKQ